MINGLFVGQIGKDSCAKGAMVPRCQG